MQNATQSRANRVFENGQKKKVRVQFSIETGYGNAAEIPLPKLLSLYLDV